MKIAKPMLLVLTPIGVVGGLYEAYRLAGGLVILMLALLLLISAAMLSIVFTIKRERAAEDVAAHKTSDAVNNPSEKNG